MITRFKCKKIILPDGIADGYVYTQQGIITCVGQDELPYDKEIDCGENYLAPGLIDLHVHGGVGFDFGSCNAEQAQKAADFHLAHGTTTLLPTLAAAPMSDMAAQLERLAPWIQSDKRVPGVHLEGPYFSKNQSGAQNTDFITPPIREDYLPFLEKYGHLVRRWSYAPELDDGSFCKTLTEADVLPSAGHTDALSTDMERAYEQGLRLITHLFSCTSTITRDKGYRRAGVIEYAYMSKDTDAEIIGDGAHLPYELIRMIVSIKGREHIALITDALSAAGCDAKEGDLNGVPYIVENGVCRLPDRSAFAGSIATADRLVRTCVSAGLSLVDSIYMAATTPARILDLPKGQIKEGMDADLIVFDEDIRISEIYIKGEKQC